MLLLLLIQSMDLPHGIVDKDNDISLQWYALSKLEPRNNPKLIIHITHTDVTALVTAWWMDTV